MELREALQKIRDSGYKLTPQRSETLRALINAGGAISAQAALEQVRAVYPCVSLDTVYRNLAMLTANRSGRADQLAGQRRDPL